MKRGCLWKIALIVLTVTGIPTLVLAIGLLIDYSTGNPTLQPVPGLMFSAIVFFTSLLFVFAFSGFALAEICLKSLVGVAGVLLVSDFIFSLVALNPFGSAITFVSWLFFCSLICLGLQRWLEIEEFPYSRPSKNFDRANLSYSLPGSSWFDRVVLDSWFIFIILSFLALVGTNMLFDLHWPQPASLYSKLILWSSVTTLLAWLFIYWKERFERRTAQIHLSVSKGGFEVEHHRTCTSSVPDDWAEPAPAITIGIPTTIGKMATLIGIACFVVLMTMNRGGIPVWLRNDLIIGLLVSGAISIFMKSQYLLDISGKTIHQEFTNPLYYRKRRIPFAEVAMVTTIGKLSEWPLLWHRYRLGYSVVIILNDGTVLELPRAEARKGKYFLHQEEASMQAQQLSQLLGCKFEPGFFKKRQSFDSWLDDVKQTIADHPGAKNLERVLWESKLSNVSLEAFGSGQVKVDLPTTREKLVLCILILLFTLSTHWLIKSEGSFIAANPRLIYLLLLDSTSVMLTLFAAWLWLIDEHYIFDLNTRMVLFRSRFLFWRRQENICSFREIRGFEVWKRYSWLCLAITDKNKRTLIPSEQYFVRMKIKGTKYFQMSDAVSLFDNIPIIRAAALSKLVFNRAEQSACPLFSEAAKKIKLSLPESEIDLRATPARPVIAAQPAEKSRRRRYRRTR